MILTNNNSGTKAPAKHVHERPSQGCAESVEALWGLSTKDGPAENVEETLGTYFRENYAVGNTFFLMVQAGTLYSFSTNWDECSPGDAGGGEVGKGERRMLELLKTAEHRATIPLMVSKGEVRCYNKGDRLRANLIRRDQIRVAASHIRLPFGRYLLKKTRIPRQAIRTSNEHMSLEPS